MPSSIPASVTAELPGATGRRKGTVILRSLLRDRYATASAIFLLIVLICAIFGPSLLSEQARALNLKARNAPPFSLDAGWMFILGADALGRSLLARIIVATQNTILISAAAVLFSVLIGGFLGLIAGYRGGWVGDVLLRLADAIMIFPSILLAMIVLFVFEPGVTNVIIVLAVSRIPIFMRTAGHPTCHWQKSRALCHLARRPLPLPYLAWRCGQLLHRESRRSSLRAGRLSAPRREGWSNRNDRKDRPIIR